MIKSTLISDKGHRLKLSIKKKKKIKIYFRKYLTQKLDLLNYASSYIEDKVSFFFFSSFFYKIYASAFNSLY